MTRLLSFFSPRPLFRLAWRHAWRRPLQSAFLIIGVAIGVAMIVAIDLANSSAGRAFALGTETITGKATHQIVGGPSGLDEQVYVNLRRELGYRLSAPVVEDYVAAPALDAQPMRLLGIDPFAEPPFRSYLGGETRIDTGSGFLSALLVQPDTVLLSAETAARYGLQAGDSLSVQIGVNTRTLTLAGLLQPSDDLSRRALDGLLIADIATAQEVLGKVGRLDRVDLIVPDGAAGESALAAIRDLLPPGVRVVSSAARGGSVAEMTAAFRLNLTALSLLALLVGMFLIYNTVTFSVVQRRPVIGSLRALGMTQREIFGMILLEAGLLGLLGTGLGLGLGVVLGRGAVQAVTQTVNDLFFVVAVRDISIPLWTLVKGGLSGMAAALVAAAIPAWEAAGVPPAGALKRSDVEQRVLALLPWISLAGGLLVVVGGLLLIPDSSLVLAFAGLFGLIIGIALLTPGATLLLMSGLQRLMGQRLGIVTRMAPRDIVRSLSRTSVAIAALMVSVSVIIGVSVMIGSFRLTVEQWLDDVLQADIFVSAPTLGANRTTAALDARLAAELMAFPGVIDASTSREVAVAARLSDGTQLDVGVAGVLKDLAGADRRYKTAVGDPAVTWRAVEAGGVVINEPMANRYGLGVGDEVTLFTDAGPVAFPVVGVAYDFDVSPSLLMADPVYRANWQDTAVSAVALFVSPGADVDAAVAELRAAFAGRAQLVIRSNRGTRQSALDVFDRTFAITFALRLLATIVAFIGILSTLMSLQLERSREIGVLRATGMTRRQLWRLTLLETGLLGAVAGLVALPTGFLLSLVLIYIINLRSFGWTLSMQLQAGDFVNAFVIALVAALLAGLYPAWRMGRTQPADALRME
ncbi:MAG: ABC transporter permease [Caldilineaceae bacterium]|nr:ABC transporter permease [Caldilineaceae bacterium]